MPTVAIVPEDRVSESIRATLPHWYNLESVIIAEFSIDHDTASRIASEANPTFPGGPNPLIREECRAQATELAYTIQQALALAAPGAFKTYPAWVRTHLDKNATEVGPCLNYALTDAAALARNQGWPQLKTLRLDSVMRWFMRLSWLPHHAGESALSRAYNALTHVIHAEHSEAEHALFYAMIGLEALYGGERESVFRTIQDRVNATLGAPTTFRRALSKMYDIRSRFVHGSLPFYPFHRPDEPSSSAEQEIDVAANTAIAVLAASLQKLIDTDSSSLRFTVTAEPVH